MSYTLTVGGVEYAPLDGSLQGDKQLNGRDSLQFSIHLEDSTQPIEVGDVVTLVVGATTVFGGTVGEIHDDDVLVGIDTRRRLTIICEDYDEVLEHRLVYEVYENQTLAAIITDINTNFLNGEGMTVTNVETGPTIDKVVFNYIPASQAFNELSDLTGFYWYVDPDLDIHFVARETNAAAFSITDLNRPYTSFTVSQKRTKYRNRQFVRAGRDLTDSRAETLVGDGERRVFTLAFPVGNTPTIEVDTGAGYVTKTVGVNGVDTGKDWYYNIDSKEVIQSSSETKLTATDMLKVTYKGLFPIVVQAQDDSEIAARAAAEGLSGVYESVVDDPTIDDSDLALNKAQALLRRYGSIDKSVNYTTRQAGLLPGQLQRIESTEHTLDGDFLIDHVSFFLDEDTHNLVYNVKALSGEAFGGWSEFFRKLAAMGRKYVIRENEVLVLLRSLSDAFSLSESLVTTEHVPSTAFVIGTAVVGYSEVA